MLASLFITYSRFAHSKHHRLRHFLLMRLIPICALLLIGLPGCSEITCSNRTVKTIESPDGKHRAILFMRECGATTDYTTQISVVNSSSPFQNVGNAFIADTYDPDAKRGNWGGPWAEIAWASSKRLIVTYDGRSRVFRRKASVDGVEIVYQTDRP